MEKRSLCMCGPLLVCCSYTSAMNFGNYNYNVVGPSVPRYQYSSFESGSEYASKHSDRDVNYSYKNNARRRDKSLSPPIAINNPTSHSVLPINNWNKPYSPLRTPSVTHIATHYSTCSASFFYYMADKTTSYSKSRAAVYSSDLSRKHTPVREEKTDNFESHYSSPSVLFLSNTANKAFYSSSSHAAVYSSPLLANPRQKKESKEQKKEVNTIEHSRSALQDSVSSAEQCVSVENSSPAGSNASALLTAEKAQLSDNEPVSDLSSNIIEIQEPQKSISLAISPVVDQDSKNNHCLRRSASAPNLIPESWHFLPAPVFGNLNADAQSPMTEEQFSNNEAVSDWSFNIIKDQKSVRPLSPATLPTVDQNGKSNYGLYRSASAPKLIPELWHFLPSPVPVNLNGISPADLAYSSDFPLSSSANNRSSLETETTCVKDQEKNVDNESKNVETSSLISYTNSEGQQSSSDSSSSSHLNLGSSSYFYSSSTASSYFGSFSHSASQTQLVRSKLDVCTQIEEQFIPQLKDITMELADCLSNITNDQSILGKVRRLSDITNDMAAFIAKQNKSASLSSEDENEKEEDQRKGLS